MSIVGRVSASYILPLLLLVFPAVAQAQSCTNTWEGTHRIVSSTGGIESFNPKKCKTFSQITEKDGQLTGSITMFGMDAQDNSQGTEKLQGTIRKQIIEWQSGRPWQDNEKEKRQYETIFRGVRDGDTIVGYFEQTWNKNGKAPVTYRGVVELNKKEKN